MVFGLICTLISPVWGSCAYLAALLLRPNQWQEGVLLPAVPLMMVAVALTSVMHTYRVLPTPPEPQSKAPRLLVTMVVMCLLHLVLFPSMFTPTDWILAEGGPILLLLYYITRHMSTPGRLKAMMGTTTACALVHGVDAFHAHYFRKASGPAMKAHDRTGVDPDPHLEP